MNNQGKINGQVDTEIKYAIDQQYRNEPETRKEILATLDKETRTNHEGGEYFIGGYKKLSFDVDPKELVNKLAQEKGYGKVVDEMLGGNGTAYFTSKGNVIKLTGDKSEYETANVIKGKNNKYIADVYESGKLNSSHIKGGEGYIVIMEELGLPKQISETFDDCCCGVNKPIYIEYEENPAVIHPPVDGSEECQKLHKNLLMIRQELTQYGIEWSDISVENLGMKNGKLALLDLGETTGGIDTGQDIELNESGANTSWSNDEDEITLQHILDLTEHIKAVDYPTEELSPIVLGWKNNPEEIERIDQVEVSKQYPILIMVTEDDKILWVLDGNHRAQQALKNDIPTIPAKLIKPSDLDERSIKMFFPKGIPSAKQKIELTEHEEPGLSPELEIGDVIKVVDIDREVENIQYNRPSPELRPEKFTPYTVVDKESNGSESKHPFRYTLIPEDKLEEYERYEALHNNPLYQKKIGVKLLFPWVHQWIYADTPMANKVDRLTISENMERELNPELGKDYIQEIVDRVYPHIVNKLGPSKYFDKPPTVELWEDLYARVSGIEGMQGEHSASSKAQFDDEVNVIYVYYPNMEDIEDIIKSLLHEYTHSLQDPDKREDNRKDGYDLDPDEIDSAHAELKWKDYLVYLKDILNEDFEGEQLKLDLPTPIGEWEFPTEWSDSEDEAQEIKDAVSDEALKYLFKKWDKKGMSFTDLKLLGIPDNNAMTRALIAKRYLKNTHKKFPVSHTFDCYDLAKMFNTNLRDIDTDYIEDYLCGKDEFWDYKDWYNYDWYDGMSDGLNKDNWETIMKILGVPTQEQAEDLIEGKSNSEEMDRIAEEKEDDIGEIKNFIVWANNDEAEYAMKRTMVEDIKDKLNDHFEWSGKLEEGDYAMTNSPSISYKIEAELFDYLEDDHWGDTELFQYHPDYTGQMLEDILIDFNPVDSNIISGDFSGEIFRAYMMDKYTFEDYDYGAQGDLLEVETKWFDGYYSPNYDINNAIYDRLNELEYENSSSGKPITGIETLEERINEDTMAKPFSKGESIILKHIYKSFTRSEIQDLTTNTPMGGKLSNKWDTLMKMFGIPTNTTESAAASTQYAKYALDNYVEAKNEDGDYSHIKKPEKNRIGWYDVEVDETGAQVEYKSGEVKILAFDTYDAEEKGASEFYDWDGEMEAYEYGDYDSYDTNIRDVEFGGYYSDVPKISEEVSGDSKKHTGEQGDFFTLDGSDNIGNTDIFRDDGFDIIHQYRGNVHLSDITPEENQTMIPQGSKKIKKTVLKPRLDKGPFNIPVKMNEHTGYGDLEDNPDLNPEVEEGDVIELLYMDDPYGIPIKTKGVVMGFEGKPGDFVFKILVNWIMGPESLTPMALLPEADIYRFPKEKLKEQLEKPYKDPKAIVNGKEIELDVADTEFMKQKGMMYKTSYPNNRGMLFLWDNIVPISMWMKNTFLPLDIIYMVDGEVVDYDKDVQPCEEQECKTYGEVNANQVLELVSGGVDNYNIQIGDKVELIDI